MSYVAVSPDEVVEAVVVGRQYTFPLVLSVVGDEDVDITIVYDNTQTLFAVSETNFAISAGCEHVVYIDVNLLDVPGAEPYNGTITIDGTADNLPIEIPIEFTVWYSKQLIVVGKISTYGGISLDEYRTMYQDARVEPQNTF